MSKNWIIHSCSILTACEGYEEEVWVEGFNALSNWYLKPKYKSENNPVQKTVILNIIILEYLNYKSTFGKLNYKSYNANLYHSIMHQMFTLLFPYLIVGFSKTLFSTNNFLMLISKTTIFNTNLERWHYHECSLNTHSRMEMTVVKIIQNSRWINYWYLTFKNISWCSVNLLIDLQSHF